MFCSICGRHGASLFSTLRLALCPHSVLYGVTGMSVVVGQGSFVDQRLSSLRFGRQLRLYFSINSSLEEDIMSIVYSLPLLFCCF
jgi:hypothetical protein